AAGSPSSPAAMPAAWLPWPGNTSATRVTARPPGGATAGPARSVDRDDLAAVVGAAVGADVVWSLHLAALGAGHQRGSVQGEVGAPAIASRLGDAFLGDCHGASGRRADTAAERLASRISASPRPLRSPTGIRRFPGAGVPRRRQHLDAAAHL